MRWINLSYNKFIFPRILDWFNCIPTMRDIGNIDQFFLSYSWYYFNSRFSSDFVDFNRFFLLWSSFTFWKIITLVIGKGNPNHIFKTTTHTTYLKRYEYWFISSNNGNTLIIIYLQISTNSYLGRGAMYLTYCLRALLSDSYIIIFFLCKFTF